MSNNTLLISMNITQLWEHCGKIIGKGIARDGLHYFSSELSVQSNINLAIRTPRTPSTHSHTFRNSNLEQCHLRLGHAPLSKIKQIHHLHVSNKPFHKVCVTCPMARFTKIHLPPSTSHASKPFDLIHLDIWGPYKDPTKGNCRFFLTLMDDNTRYTWLYLLKFKSNSLKIL